MERGGAEMCVQTHMETGLDYLINKYYRYINSKSIR
jgi:hypothetical protein